ncbi:flagellar biosynthesis/type III secretory pathway protein [Thiocystis violascens DSM 198]|uniref:Flagellar assembly protein FliH n=2 Tax=Thiocystis violascens TaxID=73141 RepID=I3Y611_THIV6|nr:flagellar biosynthesis/type III secretory pathway protein [Thiocystis violascens DSM 198]
MNRSRSGLAEQMFPDAQRWMPPDVTTPPLCEPEPEPEPLVHRPTADELAAIEEAARAAGAEAGFEAGYREGLEQALQEAGEERDARLARETELRTLQEATLQETIAALEGIAADLADPLARSADDLEPELLMLVETLAKRVVMDELRQRPDLIARVLRQALAQLPSRNRPLRVHVHPDDQAILDAYANSIGESLTWLADPAIERGGCLIESGASRIDARLETRLRQSIDAIWGELAQPMESAPAEPPEAQMEVPPEAPLENDA